jgi:hypothetical protein
MQSDECAGGARGRAPYASNAGGHATCGAMLEVLEAVRQVVEVLEVMRGMLEVVEGTRHALQVLEVVEDMGDVYHRWWMLCYVRWRSCSMWRRTCDVRARGRGGRIPCDGGGAYGTCVEVAEGLGRLPDVVDAVRCMMEVVEGMLRVC